MEKKDFRIFDFIHLISLSPKNEKNKYICPNCLGHNLSIKPDSNIFNCFNCQDNSAIVKILISQTKKPEKIYQEKTTRKWIHHDYEGNPIMQYVRVDYPNPDKKPSKFTQYLVNGEWVNSGEGVDKSKIALYQWDKVKKNLSKEVIFICEGQKSCDSFISVGLTATTNPFGAGKWISRYSKDLEKAQVVLVPDRDVNGINHCEQIYRDFPDALWLYPKPDSPLWKCLISGGFDGADWIDELKSQRLSNEEIKEIILNSVEDKPRQLNLGSDNKPQNDNSSTNDSTNDSSNSSGNSSNSSGNSTNYSANSSNYSSYSRKKEKEKPKLNKVEIINRVKEILLLDLDEVEINFLITEVCEQTEFSFSFFDNKIVKPLRQQYKTERLKLEMSIYNLESDPFVKTRIKQKIQSFYCLSNYNFTILSEASTLQEKTPEKSSYSFREFLNKGTKVINWLIPCVLPVGEMLLLTALPKVGKSLLASEFAYSVLAGDKALGETALKGRVLYVGSDESSNSLTRRFQNRGFDLLPEADNNLRIMTHLDMANLSELENELDSFRPHLVIFDSLTSITQSLNISEKDAEFARPIYQLKDLLGKYGSASILIHHDNKSKEAKGICKVSGSARITAAVWGIAQLSGGDKLSDNPSDDLVKGQNVRQLEIQPREGELSKYIIEINPRDLWAIEGIFNFKGEFDDPNGEKRTYCQQVVDLLTRTRKKMEVFEINEILSISHSIYSILDRLGDRQLICRQRSQNNPRSWVYFVPETTNIITDLLEYNYQEGQEEKITTPPPPSNSPPNALNNSETIINKGIESIQHPIQHPIQHSNLSVQQTTKVEKSETIDNKGNESIQHPIQHPVNLEGGDWLLIAKILKI